MALNLVRGLMALMLAMFLAGGVCAAEAGGDAKKAEESAESELASGTAEVSDDTDEGSEEESVPLPRRIASFTQSAAEGAINQFQRAVAVVSSVRSSRISVDWTALGASLMTLAAVIVATLIVFGMLRWLARGVFTQLNRWALGDSEGLSVVRRVIAVAAAVVADVVVVVLAWVSGYAVALFGLGDTGEMTTAQSLFLNAFLAIEVFKALIRMIFAAKDEGLRLLPLPAADAAYWNIRLALLAGFLGYSLLLVVPVVSEQIAPAVSSILSPFVKFVAFAYAAAVIARNRCILRDRILGRARQKGGMGAVAMAALAHTWYIIAIVYLGGLMLASMIRPEESLPFVMAASLQTLLAIAAGVFAAIFLGQLMRRPIRVPERTRQTLPQLEQRLNGFVPLGLKIARVVITIVVLAVVLDAWRVFFDLRAWAASDAGATIIGALMSVAFIALLAAAAWIGFASWVEHRLNPDAGRGEPDQREKTLLSLFRTAVMVVLVTVAVMISLAELGVNIGPMLAGAGVIGLAIGFGAQSLVKDVITGIFIQLENAINRDDFVTVAGLSGTVEKVSLRSVALRDLSGTFHIIPFSSVDTVSNFTRDFAYHLGVYGIAYHESVDEAVEQLQAAFEELEQDPTIAPMLLGGLEVDGVTQFADSSINIRIRIMTLPGYQWAVGRAYNKLVKTYFDAADIEIPFPHRTLYFGDSSETPKLDAAESGTSDAEGRPSEEGAGAEG